MERLSPAYQLTISAQVILRQERGGAGGAREHYPAAETEGTKIITASLHLEKQLIKDALLRYGLIDFSITIFAGRTNPYRASSL